MDAVAQSLRFVATNVFSEVAILIGLITLVGLVLQRKPVEEVVPSGPAATAALSSLAAVYCWNLVLARLADRAAVAGLELPLWASANTVAGDERNAALAERFRARIPTL